MHATSRAIAIAAAFATAGLVPAASAEAGTTTAQVKRPTKCAAVKGKRVTTRVCAWNAGERTVKSVASDAVCVRIRKGTKPTCTLGRELPWVHRDPTVSVTDPKVGLPTVGLPQVTQPRVQQLPSVDVNEDEITVTLPQISGASVSGGATVGQPQVTLPKVSVDPGI